MIDLREARKSFDFYASLLDLQCGMYRVASTANEKAKRLSVESSNSPEQIVAELKRRQSEGLALSVMVSEEIAKRAPDFLDEPDVLAGALQAQSRMVIAVNKAIAVIEEHERVQAKNGGPEESVTALAIKAFKERRGLR